MTLPARLFGGTVGRQYITPIQPQPRSRSTGAQRPLRPANDPPPALARVPRRIAPLVRL